MTDSLKMRGASAIYREDEPAPCDRCSFHDQCGERLLACSTFSSYVSGRRYDLARFATPNHSTWLRIYDHDEVTA